MAEAIEAGGEAAGMLGRAVTQQLVATTAGIRRATAATEASGSLTATVDDGTAHWVDLSRSAGRLDVAGSVSRAVAQAQAGRGRADLPAGRYPVVLGAEAVGELLGFLPDVGFTGTLAAAGIGITAQAGQPLAASLVDVADDGGADVGLPIGFDIEGVTKRRVDFFRHGAGRRGGHRPGHRRRPRPAVHRARAHRPRAGPRADRAQHRHVRRPAHRG